MSGRRLYNMQLREEIKSNNGTIECPVNDWFCKYFENGSCKFKDAFTKCSHLRGINDKKSKVILE